jgi:membrane-bound metal-dependent hydrolase YbcI (DUF457 family)
VRTPDHDGASPTAWPRTSRGRLPRLRRASSRAGSGGLSCSVRGARPAGPRKPTDAPNTLAHVRNVTHELIGVSAAIGAAKTAGLGPAATSAAAVAAFYGSWLPDVDQLGSRVHRRSRLEGRSLVVGAVGALLRLPLVALGALASHRAATHSAIACVAVAGGVALALAPLGLAVAPIVAGAMGLGYAAHVLADACTPAGVRLWWPLSRGRVWLLPSGCRIATGSLGELLIAVCVLALVVVLVVA